MKYVVVLFISVLSFLRCSKKVEIQDPHFKELVGTWTTVDDTEKKTVIVSKTGEITIRHSVERGYQFTIDRFSYGTQQIVVDGDTLQRFGCYDDENSNAIAFYKQVNVDSACVAVGLKIHNQTVDGQRSLFVKIK